MAAGVAAAALSPDGRYAIFLCYSPYLGYDDANGTLDVFLQDFRTGRTTRLTSRPSDASALPNSNITPLQPYISDSGRFATFSIGGAMRAAVGISASFDDTYVRLDLRNIGFVGGTNQDLGDSRGRFTISRIKSPSPYYLTELDHQTGTTTSFPNSGGGSYSFPALSGDGSVVGCTYNNSGPDLIKVVRRP